MRARASAVSCPQALCRDRKCPGGEERGTQSPCLPGSPSTEALPLGVRRARVGSRASPAAAPLASVPGPPLSWAWRRPHCSRPTLASSQPAAVGGSKSVVPAEAADTERPPLAAGAACREERAPRGSSCPSPHSRSSSPPSHCCWKSHSCSGGTHRSPQDRRPGSQKPWGCWPDAWSQGAGPQSSGGGPDVPVGGRRRRGGQAGGS